MSERQAFLRIALVVLIIVVAGTVSMASLMHGYGTGGWCWFGDPRAVEVGSEVYVGSLSGQGRALVTRISDGHVSDLWGGPLEIDDHDNPALIEYQGQILAFFSRHVGPELYMAIGNGEAFGRPVVLDLGSPAYTYPSPVVFDDTLYLFWRSARDEWSYSTTTNLEVWAPARPFSRFTYHKIASDGSRIEFAASNHPDSPDGDGIWHFTFDGAFSEPVLIDSRKGWVWDAEPGVIAYATFPATYDHRYHIARFDGAWTTTEIGRGGGTIATAPYPSGNAQPYYSGGIALGDGVVYTSEQGGADWNIYRYPGRVPLTAGDKNIRPTSVGTHVLWLTGRYDSYVDYELRMSMAR
jgi:hypothetical protein